MWSIEVLVSMVPSRPTRNNPYLGQPYRYRMGRCAPSTGLRDAAAHEGTMREAFHRHGRYNDLREMAGLHQELKALERSDS